MFCGIYVRGWGAASSFKVSHFKSTEKPNWNFIYSFIQTNPEKINKHFIKQAQRFGCLKQEKKKHTQKKKISSRGSFVCVRINILETGFASPPEQNSNYLHFYQKTKSGQKIWAHAGWICPPASSALMWCDYLLTRLLWAVITSACSGPGQEALLLPEEAVNQGSLSATAGACSGFPPVQGSMYK